MKARYLFLFLIAAIGQTHGQAADTNLKVTMTWGGQPDSVAPDTLPPDAKPVGVGAWSEPVADGHGNKLRGRITVYQGGIFTDLIDPGQLGWTAAPVYLEIQDLAGSNKTPTQIYLDPLRINCELRAPRDQTAIRLPALDSRIPPGGFWLAVPAGGTLRFRADNWQMRTSKSRGGRRPAPGDLYLTFSNQNLNWMIPAEDRNDYFLSVASPLQPTNSVAGLTNAWQGNLVFPPVLLSNKPQLPVN